MIIPDVNLPIYAYNADATHHGAARLWWEDLRWEGLTMSVYERRQGRSLAELRGRPGGS